MGSKLVRGSGLVVGVSDYRPGNVWFTLSSGNHDFCPTAFGLKIKSTTFLMIFYKFIPEICPEGDKANVANKSMAKTFKELPIFVSVRSQNPLSAT